MQESTENMFDLKGKRAVITGGSRGIGKAAAEALAAFGARTVLIARSEDVLRNSEKIAEMGTESHAIRADIARRDERRKAMEKAMNLLGGIDILVNNAGMGKEYNAVDFPLDVWDQIIELNLTAAFELCQIAGRHMIQNNGGKIINVCSLHSFLGKQKIEAYTASKGGLALLTKSLAHEWGPFGVCVNGLAPGFIETDISFDLRNDTVLYEKTLDRLPMGRWGKTEDLKGAFVFLASGASDYVNGHILAVDGGILAI